MSFILLLLILAVTSGSYCCKAKRKVPNFKDEIDEDCYYTFYTPEWDE